MNELFIISPSAMKAYDGESIKATTDDLKELGLFKLPYDRIDIQIAVDFTEEKNRTDCHCNNQQRRTIMTEPMNAERLAGRVLHALYEDLDAVQTNIITLVTRVREFGDGVAIPTKPYWNRRTVSDAAQNVHDNLKRLRERHDELLATIEALEALFAEKEDADLSAFADWIKDRQQQDRKAKPNVKRGVMGNTAKVPL